MAEIWKGNQGAAADAEHVVQHLQRLTNLLQGLAEDDVVEGLVGVISQAFFDVTLVAADSFSNRLLHLCAIHFDSARIDVLVVGEPTQQFSVAAAKIEDARLGRDDFTENGLVATTEQVAY